MIIAVIHIRVNRGDFANTNASAESVRNKQHCRDTIIEYQRMENWNEFNPLIRM